MLMVMELKCQKEDKWGRVRAFKQLTVQSNPIERDKDVDPALILDKINLGKSYAELC